MVATHILHSRRHEDASAFYSRVRIALDLLLNGIRVRALGAT